MNTTRKKLTSPEWEDIHNRILDAPFYENKRGKRLVLENWDYDSDSGNIILYYSGLKDFGIIIQNKMKKNVLMIKKIKKLSLNYQIKNK